MQNRTHNAHKILVAVASMAILPLAAQPIIAAYDLAFLNSDLDVVPTLPVCTTTVVEELVLHAHVETATGPAQGGAVVFQYCSYKGLPPDDINRPDEAPSEACMNGSAKWANLGVAPISASGDAYMSFGCVRIPRTVGFRYKYVAQGSGIKNGVAEPADFTWLPAP